MLATARSKCAKVDNSNFCRCFHHQRSRADNTGVLPEPAKERRIVRSLKNSHSRIHISHYYAIKDRIR
jgi:hypothetical protein